MNDEISKLYSNDNLSSLSRVTLVIPTHNRNFYLSRCLWYHAHFPFFEIIVADSSELEKREINKKTIRELSQLFQTRITYLEYNFPAEEYGGEIYRKWGDAIHHVTTDYSLSCTDKEFLIPTTVVNSVHFLDKNPDYSLADGIYYMMNSKKDILPWQERESITENSPTERLNKLKLTKQILGTQFALHRTNEHIQNFENLIKYELFDIRFGEMIIEAFPILIGKLNRDTNCVMSIRDTTENYKQYTIINCITKNLKKYNAESSFTRYKTYMNYPLDRRNKLLQKFKDSIENIININEDIEFYSQIMDKRYGSKSDNYFISLINKIHFFCWRFLIPYKLKYILSHLFGLGKMEKRIKLAKASLKIRYVFNMILETRHYIPTDTPITQTNIFRGKIK